MHIRRSTGVALLALVLLLAGISVGLLVWLYPRVVGIPADSDQYSTWLLGIAAATLMCLLGVVGYHLLGLQLGRSEYSRQRADDASAPSPETVPDSSAEKSASTGTTLVAHLRQHHGVFWRTRIRFLLVVGEPEQIEAIAKGLADRQWLESENNVLLWGGSPNARLAGAFALWSELTRWRALEGVVWALNSAQIADASAMTIGARHLQDLARRLQWQLPLHLWQVCASEWPQNKRDSQPVGCLLPARLTEKDLGDCLARLQQPLRQNGLAQMGQDIGHDFLLRLSRHLDAQGITRWRQALAPLLGRFARGVPLRGVWFSLSARQTELSNSVWLPEPAWVGVLGDKAYGGRHLGWPATRISHALALAVVLILGAGLLLSYVSNRGQIARVQASLVAAQPSENRDLQLLALNELMRELGRLDERARHGEPWYQRFGLSQNRALLDALWPRYVEANNRLLRDPAAANLARQLRALVDLPPDSPQRAKRAHNAYVQLKAYLMMARPEKADAAFLLKALAHAEPARAGVAPDVWKSLSATLWQFYAEHLGAHPDWRIEADQTLITQARQVLIAQLGQRNGEAGLYQKVLESAASHHPDLSLQEMVGETEVRALFSSDARVAGVFTRQAWEGKVRQAIDDIAEARREEIDWVLSDREADIASELTPNMLKERLTERYFQDYGSAWLEFLNSLRWQRADSLGEVIDQLTLMSDVRQSPLIALMNTVAWQGQAGKRTQALADSLVKSAQKLIGRDDVPAIDQQLHVLAGPLDATFAPLLALVGKDAESNVGDDQLSLQAFLTQVIRVRLKLQQVSNATDPQGMTQAMAQAVFQGKSVDLTDTQSYGGLIAASLGAEWSRVGHTLFVQPLDQAWQRVLQPSAAGLNRQWQQSIVDHWEGAFAGRYPFVANGNDASLPMLGKMIRSDSGHIEQFLQRQLNGVLRKEGGHWLADPSHSQGLRFNPQFLIAINQLSHLADVLYTDGGMGLSFELQGKPVRDVVQTTFILDGERHQYFNQRESWQRFDWPGSSDRPGASLSWTSVQTGERLFGDFQGSWGLIRLLEKARITTLDDGDSRYRIVLKAPDGLNLTWHLRTELGAGPISLLKLRDFKLPQHIFLTEGVAARTVTPSEVYE